MRRPLLRKLSFERAEIGRDLRSNQDDGCDGAHGDDADQQAVFDQVLALLVANQLRKKLLHGSVSNVSALVTTAAGGRTRHHRSTLGRLRSRPGQPCPTLSTRTAPGPRGAGRSSGRAETSSAS